MIICSELARESSDCVLSKRETEKKREKKMNGKKKVIHNKLMLFIAIVGLLMESK